MFPCRNMIHWIVSHIDLDMMMLSSVSRIELATFRAKDFQEMYHLPQPVITMEKPFMKTSSSANSRDILKSWAKELAKFRTTPIQVYKMKRLQKAYHYLVIFAHQLCGQEST